MAREAFRRKRHHTNLFNQRTIKREVEPVVAPKKPKQKPKLKV